MSEFLEGGEAPSQMQREKVPLLRPWKAKPGRRQEEAGANHKNSWTILFAWLKHTIMHGFIFSVVSIIFMVGFHQNPKLLMAIAAFFIFALLSDAVYLYATRPKLSKEVLLFAVSAFAIFAGGVVGTSIHMTKLIDYWPYYQMRHYTNVAPDEPAATHADASVIVFMEGARPDASRSMGYTRQNSIYCVAPIALEAGYTDEETVSPNIEYWAIGKDCCGGHKGFVCDGAEDPKARSGLVMMKKTGDDLIMEGVMSSDEMNFYEKAVLMTQSKFDLNSPKERMYVRFVQDIDAARLGYWGEALGSWTRYQFIWLLVWAVVGIMTIVIGMGDPEDENGYKEHLVDLKQSVLHKVNLYI